MSRLANLRRDVRMFRATRSFLLRYREPSVEEAAAQMKVLLQTREERFLEMMDRCVWKHPGSPYLPLLGAAGCEPGDVRALVREHGLEGALSRLKEAGVYVTFEEFKGRTPVDRNDVSFATRPEDFDNPIAARHTTLSTGGSTGTGTRVWQNLSDTERWDVHRVFAMDAHGLRDLPIAFWGNPTVAGMMGTLTKRQHGDPPRRRFVVRLEQGATGSLGYAASAALLRATARIGGLSIAEDEWIDGLDALPIARWSQKMVRSYAGCAVNGSVSRAVRVAVAAVENAVSLDGVTFYATGEPATPAKVNAITRSGARFVPYYAFAEGGGIGWGCVNPVDGSDVHFWSDRFELIQAPRLVGASGISVNSFYFTTLSELAHKVMLNTELDDFGIVERRECGCPIGELGFDRHLREIFSFAKLTGEGVTLIGTDLVRVLEEVLPRRFGGSPLDYQLIEEEDDSSLTRLSLIIDPRVRIDDESKVVTAVLDELRRTDAPSRMGSAIWAQSETLRIKRMRPITTPSRGKLLPLHVSQRTSVVP